MLLTTALAFAGCSLVTTFDDLVGPSVDAASDQNDAAIAAVIDAATDATRDSAIDVADSSGPYLIMDGVAMDPGATIDLTTVGTVDWAHYGATPDSKNVQKHFIGALSSPDKLTTYQDDSRSFSWTDGTTTKSQTDVSDGTFIYPDSLELQVVADATPRVLYVYAGSYDANSTLTTTLGTLTASKMSAGVSSDSQYYLYAIHFSSPAGDPLMLTWTFTSIDSATDQGNVTCAAAALANE